MPPVSATDAGKTRSAGVLEPALSPINRQMRFWRGRDAPQGDPTFSAIADPKPGDWLTYNGHLSGNRHSALNQINTANIAQLGARWMFNIPVAGGWK